MAKICLVPGGQRCGSTYLFELLDQIDVVRSPILSQSEPKWFLEKNIELKNKEDYLYDIFAKTAEDSELLYIDKSTSYFTDKNVPLYVNKILGQPYILIILRDPVQRAISHYKFSRNNGVETLDFAQALRIAPNTRNYNFEEISTNPFNYLEGGLFYRYLINWKGYFTKVKVIFLEELISDSKIFLDVLNFLEIDNSSNLKYWNSKKQNESNSDWIEIRSDDILYLKKYYSTPNSMLQDLLSRQLPISWLT